MKERAASTPNLRGTPLGGDPRSVTPLVAIQAVAESAFNAVFDTSSEALLIVDSAGSLRRANGHARKFLQLQSESAPQKKLRRLLRGPVIEQFASLRSSSLVTAAPQSLDVFAGTGRPIRVTLRSIVPGTGDLLLCLEEGSVAQRAESEWRQLDAELRSVLESVEGGVLILDPLGHIRLSSPRFAELFGLDASTASKISKFDQLADVLASRFRTLEAFTGPWKSFASGSGFPRRDELEIMLPSPRVLERFSRPVRDSQGNSVGWLEIYSDVTELRQVHAKMIQTEKMAALGQVVSGIAHELNNPLTTIMGYAQLLLGRGLIPKYLPEARSVFHEAERARRIVKNLLYFARENKPERAPVSLNEVIERTLVLRSYELRIEDISVDCDLALDLPKTMADPYQLQQAVLNLIINAEQALLEDRGHGRIRISTRCVAAKFGNRIFLEISDNGPGVPVEVASRIFDPFFTTKAPGVGTGLGLSIVYGIVRQHDGEVSLESECGSGARFVIELPVVAPPAGADRDRGLKEPGQSVKISPKRILVVEDEPTIARLVADILREDGHHADCVLDSQEGLTLLSRGTYDLVVCDLRMPRLDGRGFYQALVRASSPMQHKVVFITGDTLAPRTLDFLESNHLPYLSKPFLVEELKLTVYRYLDIGKENAGIPKGKQTQAEGRKRTRKQPRK